jgi:hypothetical protein
MGIGPTFFDNLHQAYTQHPICQLLCRKRLRVKQIVEFVLVARSKIRCAATDEGRQL